MVGTRRPGLSSALLLSLALGAVPAVAQEARPDQLWDDFNHYVLIAKPDLAAAAGEALLAQTEPGELLDVVERSQFADFSRTLSQAQKIDAVREVARAIEADVQSARVTRSRDVQRILDAIEKLDDGARAYANNVEVLRGAGQYAAPHLLATLQDEGKQQLHPYVVSAIVAVGRPLVYPLAVALPDLNPVTQQQVARALAEIGYPMVLPYLKQVIESPRTDPAARQALEAAYRQVLRTAHAPANASAAELYFRLAADQYAAATGDEKPVGFDSATGKGLVWSFVSGQALVPTEVPGEIFGDVLAMRHAQAALALDPAMDKALSLWLMANLRRENRLPAGEADASYPEAMKPALFYAMLAGPLRQHEVLSRALDDRDANLALDAIAALAATAGPEALVKGSGTLQPLTRALSYPDRRVRYSAAITLAAARPAEGFAQDHRVVPVLGEALRSSDTRIAAVVATSQEQANALQTAVKAAGLETYADTELSALMPALENVAGLDVLVVSGDAARVEQVYRATADNPKLAGVPVLAVVSPAQEIDLRPKAEAMVRLSTTTAAEGDALTAALNSAAAAVGGSAMEAAEAERYALTAAAALHQVAISSTVLQADDAQAPLTEALKDTRPAVATAAAKVLARIDNEAAQRAIATAALTDGDPDVQVSLLQSLATSANSFGNKLEQPQTDKLLDLVKTAGGPVAIAAAQAHGALTLPTAHAVELLLQK